MSIKIAIPTHNRTNIKTLSILSEFPQEDIYAFVNDEVQLENYQRDNGELKIIVTHTTGIQSARNYILDFFVPGTEILMLDDDISGLYKLDGGIKNGNVKTVLKEMTGLETKLFIEEGFEKAKKYGAMLWGIYPVENPYFMSNKLNNKGFIIGSFSGIINNELRFRKELPLKEDYAFTLDNIIKFKKVMRFDNVAMRIEHYTNEGGCVSTRKNNTELEKECFLKLIKMYPRFLRPNPERTNEVLISL